VWQGAAHGSSSLRSIVFFSMGNSSVAAPSTFTPSTLWGGCQGEEGRGNVCVCGGGENGGVGKREGLAYGCVA
jgi:hypothetical protein